MGGLLLVIVAIGGVGIGKEVESFLQFTGLLLLLVEFVLGVDELQVDGLHLEGLRFYELLVGCEHLLQGGNGGGGG